MFNQVKLLFAMSMLGCLTLTSHADTLSSSPKKDAAALISQQASLKDSPQAEQKKLVVSTTVKTNLNVASSKAIADAFKGIGPKRAQAIVDYRLSHGPFKSIEDLHLVKGISKYFVNKYIEQLKQAFTV